MRFKQLLTKTLLVAAGLGVGANSAWGDDITITYDFQSYAKTKCPTFRDEVYITLGSSVGNVYESTQNYLVNELPDFSFGGNFAFQSTDFRFRNSSSTGDEDRRGIFTNGKDRFFSIVDLAIGDKVKLYFPDESGVLFVSTNATYDNAGTPTAVSLWTPVVSEREYTITSAGRLDLQQKGKTNSYMTLLKVEIVTSRSETITEPSIAATGTYGNQRTVTITAGTSSIKSGVATYYTLDGSTPTTSSTKYTEPFTIDANKTIKAITVSNSSAKTSSTVASQEITAGVPISVAAPTITFSSMVANGDFYSPQYSIANGDNSDILGTPSPTLSATFNGAAVDISAGTFTPNTKGTLVVTASADGYNSTSTELSITHGLYACQSTPNFNEIALTDLATILGGTWEEYDGAARESEWSKTGGVNADLTPNGGGSYYKYKLTSSGSVTVGSWFTFTRNRGSSVLRVLAGYGLGEKGYIPSMTINSPVEGGIIEYCNGKSSPAVTYVTMTAENEAAKSWSATGLAAAQALRYCKYYTPLPILSDGDAVNLTFHNAGVTGDNNNNWNLNVYNSSSTQVANIRADWWDGPNYPEGSGAGFTYPYSYSADGGNTPGPNVWATFQSDMTNADVALNLTYTEGTLYVTGTMTHDQKVYYVNYKKTGLDGNLTYNLVGNGGAVLTSIVTASTTPVTTAAAHPTKINAGTVGATGYSTFASTLYPLDLSTIDGAEAYYAETVDTENKKVVFESTTASVPAGEGLLLKGTAGTAVTINIADAGTAISGNKLVGCITETADVSGADKYVLVNNAGTAEFQNLGTSPATIPAGKAYLNAGGSSAKSLKIVFDDETLGINDASMLNGNAEGMNDKQIFNLSGQRIAAPQKGINIIGGRKVVVK